MDTTFLISTSLLFLRLIIAVIFFSSGKGHAQNPKERSESIGMSETATFILGIVEVVAAIFIALGILTKIGVLLLMLTMIGALYKKLVVWKTKFYEDKGYGWHYDLLLLLGLFVILTTGGGNIIIYNLF